MFSFLVDESMNPELAYLAEIRRVRDNKPELFEKVKKLPLKAKTAKMYPVIKTDSTITFIRKGALKKFFITDKDTREISFMTAANHIKSDKNEKRYSIESDYFSHLEKNKNAFDDALTQDIEIVTEKTGAKGNDAKIIKYLKALQKSKILTDVEDSYIVRMLGLWENGEIPSGISKQIIKDLKNVEDEVEVYNVIMNGVPAAYFAESRRNIKKSREEKQIILSMYLKSEV